MATVVLHLMTGVAVATAAAGLIYGWLIDMNLFDDSPGETAGWQAFTQVAATTAAGVAFILLSTYHRCLEVKGALKAHLQQVTAVLILGSWGLAGYLASMAVGEGLVFYFFLVPPFKYLATSYLDTPMAGLPQFTWIAPWYVRLYKRHFSRR